MDEHGKSAEPDASEVTSGRTAGKPAPDRIEERKKQVRHTLRCPYCEEPLTRWKVPDTPFNEWDAEYLYVCFNSRCPYTTRSWDVMRRQGNAGFCYRFMYHRERDRFYCVPDVGFGNVG